MFNLKTANNERLEIFGNTIIAVMKPCNGVNPCAIVHDMGQGMRVDQLSDQYGYVKKLLTDSTSIINAIEVRIVEGGNEGKLFFSRNAIVSRREVKGGADGINAVLAVDLFGRLSEITVADTLDEMDGVEPDTKEGSE